MSNKLHPYADIWHKLADGDIGIDELEAAYIWDDCWNDFDYKLHSHALLCAIDFKIRIKQKPPAHKAMLFAMEVHKDQKRKYTGDPYFSHLAEVAGIVASQSHQALNFEIATAWLHDCVEDQGVTEERLRVEFGEQIADGVMLLSDLEEGNRETRKRLSRERLSKAPAWVQTIKCADLISNTKSIVQHDPKFAAVYLKEKALLLDVLTDADHELLKIARSYL